MATRNEFREIEYLAFKAPPPLRLTSMGREGFQPDVLGYFYSCLGRLAVRRLELAQKADRRRLAMASIELLTCRIQRQRLQNGEACEILAKPILRTYTQ